MSEKILNEDLVQRITELEKETKKLKKAEGVLLKERNLTGVIIDSMPGIFYMFDPDGRFLLWNRKLEKLSQYCGDEISRMHPLDFVGDHDKEKVEKAICQVFESGRASVEGDFLSKDGSLTSYLYSGELILVNNKKHLVGLGIDITARIEAQKAQRDSDLKLRAVFDQAFQFIGLLDPQGTVIDANKSSLKFLDLDKKDVLGKPFWETKWWAHSKELQGRLKQALAKAANGEFARFEAYHQGKDSKVHFIDVSITPIIGEDGRVQYLIPEGRDITNLKNAEMELQESREKLARLKRMESLGLMAGGIAHDLNNILSGIVSYPDLLLKDMPKENPLRKPIEIIRESGHRAAGVVMDLLTFTRGAATGRDVFNLNMLLEEYLGSAEHNKILMRHPDVRVKVAKDPDLFDIKCSPVHIKKTLMNLVINASEAISGEGTIAIATKNRYVDEPLKGYEDVRIGEYAVVSVADTGEGISSNDLERIFEPFYSKKIMGKSGTGLGLAVVWNTVQDHDGYVNVTSDRNGSNFELYFPITRESSSLLSDKAPETEYQGNGEKLLIIDDEENQREIGKDLLMALGYQVEAVPSGAEAVEYLKRCSADLIILDMILCDGWNGCKTYSEILKVRPRQKAIIASGFAETSNVKATQRMGAGKYIKKPYTLEQIGKAVKDELNRNLKVKEINS